MGNGGWPGVGEGRRVGCRGQKRDPRRGRLVKSVESQLQSCQVGRDPAKPVHGLRRIQAPVRPQGIRGRAARMRLLRQTWNISNSGRRTATTAPTKKSQSELCIGFLSKRLRQRGGRALDAKKTHACPIVWFDLTPNACMPRECLEVTPKLLWLRR